MSFVDNLGVIPNDPVFLSARSLRAADSRVDYADTLSAYTMSGRACFPATSAGWSVFLNDAICLSLLHSAVQILSHIYLIWYFSCFIFSNLLFSACPCCYISIQILFGYFLRCCVFWKLAVWNKYIAMNFTYVFADPMKALSIMINSLRWPCLSSSYDS